MIDAEWIDYWSKRYPPGYDEKVLNQVGPQVRARGYYLPADLLAVGEWKLQRSYWPKHKRNWSRTPMKGFATSPALRWPRHCPFGTKS